MDIKPKFCVITTQRSGSTWLKHLLGSHPQIKMFFEPFLWREVKKGWSDEVFPRYYDYYHSNFNLRPFVLFNYLNILETYDSEPHDTIGFKIMYNQIAQNPEFLFKIIKDRYKVIHLARRNHLDVLISKTVAKQYGIFHVKNSKSKTNPVTLNTSSLIRTLDLYEAMYKVMKTTLNILPLNVLEIHYESLKEDRQTNLDKIADFLGVDSQENVYETTLKKANPGSYQEKIINYDEVVEVLKSSRYANLISH